MPKSSLKELIVTTAPINPVSYPNRKPPRQVVIVRIKILKFIVARKKADPEDWTSVNFVEILGTFILFSTRTPLICTSTPRWP